MNGMEKEIIEVSLDDIIPNRFQPRLAFDEKGLNELAESIRQHGIIQPLVLRKVSDKYEIIAGERRYKAAYIAGLNKVPAVIIDLNDNESAEVAIVENIQRRDLSPIEEAKSYKKLLDRGYLTQDQLAVRMGKTQATISNKLRLLNLADEVQEALLNNKISERHARSLLRLNKSDDQIYLLNEIIKNRLNVRETENLINNKLNGIDFISEEENSESSSDEGGIDFNTFFKQDNDLPIINEVPLEKNIINFDENDTYEVLEEVKDYSNEEKKIRRFIDNLNLTGTKASYNKKENDKEYEFIIKIAKN